MTLTDAAKLSQLFYRFLCDNKLPEQAEKACFIAMYHIDELLADKQEHSKNSQFYARGTRMENDKRAARFEATYGEKLVTNRKEEE